MNDFDIVVFTDSEAAAILKVTLKEMKMLIESDRIRAVKIGKGYRITRRALLEFLGEENGQ